MSVVKLTVENFEQEVLQAEKLVLVDFYADWCGPCKMMSPIVDEIAEEESEIKVCNINIDQAMEIAQKYRVMSIPTFIAFKNGEEAGRQIGAVSKGELLSLIKYSSSSIQERYKVIADNGQMQERCGKSDRSVSAFYTKVCRRNCRWQMLCIP